MSHHVGQRPYAIALLMVVLLLALVAIGSQGPTQAAIASNTGQSLTEMGVTGQVTDVISVALDVAKSSGLTGDPSDMYIAQGVYKELRGPSVLESIYDDRIVWVVRLDAGFAFDGYGVSAFPINHLYIYIDAETGFALGRSAAKSPVEELNRQSWVKVSKSDIGKFPIPKFVPDGSGADSPGPTATPAQP